MSTFRSDLVAAMVAMVQDYITANPTLLRRVFRIRPPSLNTDLPCAYVDLRPETIPHDSGLRVRVMNPSIVVVDRLTDNGETYDRLDDLVDALVEHFTGYPHIVAGSWWSVLTVADESEELGDGKAAAAVRFTFNDLSFAEGRN